eukprot:COSAG02_NODE_2830_length_7936_cov_40.231849_11_plen_73_part_00
MPQAAAKVAVVMVVVVTVMVEMGDHSAHRTGRNSHCEQSAARLDTAVRKPSGFHQGMTKVVEAVQGVAEGSV